MKAYPRILLVLMLVFSAVHAIDFVAYGQKLQSALAAVGFGLMAWGSWRSPVEPAAAGGGAVAGDQLARGLSVCGIVLVVAYLVLKFSGYPG